VILALAVGLGAALGAVARFLVDQAISRRLRTMFPAGTWFINISGSFVLGLLAGPATRHGLAVSAVAILGTGVCGGYTTFSTFTFDSVRLMREGSGNVALANLLGSIAAGLAATALGLGIGAL
jgi:CrcB protein